MTEKDLIKLLGSKWMKEILILLSESGESRFSEILAELNMTSKVLSDKLSKLRSRGLVKRQLKEDRSTTYSLTKRGEEVVDLIKKISEINKAKQSMNSTKQIDSEQVSSS